MKNPTPTAREALKESSADLKGLATEIQRLKAALAEARRQSAEAQAVLKALGDLDFEVAKFRGQALKAGRNPRVLTDELKAKATRKRDAEIEASQSAETVELLQSELQSSQEELTKLKSSLVSAAGRVLVHEIIQPIVDRMSSLQAEFWALSQIRAGFANLVYFDGQGNRMSLGDANGGGFTAPEFPWTADPTQVQAQRFRVMLDALLADPAAALAMPEVITPANFDGK